VKVADVAELQEMLTLARAIPASLTLSEWNDFAAKKGELAMFGSPTKRF
jgi:hypothetical protein